MMELIEAVVTQDGVATVRAGGESVRVAGPGDLASARAAVLGAANDAVREQGAACRLEITDQGNRHVFAVHPDGSRVPIVEDAPEVESAPAAPEPLESAVTAPVIEDIPTGASLLAAAEATLPVAPQPAANGQDAPPAAEQQLAEEPQEPASTVVAEASTPVTPPTRRSLRETSFLVEDSRTAPASQGLRGLLRYVGIDAAPSAAELAEREDASIVKRNWAGCPVISVANRKGGSFKTPAVALLASVFGRYGGGGVLAWDNNENSGTLPLRTQHEAHGASVLDLLRDEDHLSTGNMRGLINGYVHHQGDDQYDVLWSDQNDFGDHEIQADEVHRTFEIAKRYFRMIIMDSGNTARAANWKAMIELTNQLVIPTTTMEDRAELGKRTLETIASRDEHGARLAENAVVMVSCWKPGDQNEAKRIHDLFEPLVRSVVVIPFDPALKAGKIRFDDLHATTRRAALAAAAAVGRGL